MLYSELRKMKTVAISNNVWTQPSGAGRHRVYFEIWLGPLSDQVAFTLPRITLHRWLQQALPLMDSLYCTFDLTHIQIGGPWAGNYDTSQLGFLTLLLFFLLASVSRTIFNPLSEQHNTGNWHYLHSTKSRMHCSPDTSCRSDCLLWIEGLPLVVYYVLLDRF